MSPLLVIALALAPQQPEPVDFEVLVLATYHAPVMFLGDDYTPAHIRATLALARPDVVGVECEPTWFARGRYHVVTYEAQGVAVPWARGEGIPAYGVDWKDVAAWERGEEQNALEEAGQLREEIARGGALPMHRFGNVGGAVPRREPIDWQHINSEAYGRTRLGPTPPDDPEFAARRDREIAARCIEVMRAHAGKRLVVVIGAHHKPYLDILLRRRGVRVLEIGVDVPFPTPAQVRAAWTPDDLVATLGHRLDARPRYLQPEAGDLASTRALLALLRQTGERPDAARYLEARLQQAEGQAEAAEGVLDALIAGGRDGSVYPFPMRVWRMRYTLAEAVRVEKARLLLRRGARDEARPLLESVRASVGARLARCEAEHAPRERRVEVVKDAGFESGKRGDWPDEGWWTYLPAGQGRLAFAGDEDVRTAGARSLRVEVTETRPRGAFALVQAMRVPWGFDLPVDPLGVDVRAEGIEKIELLMDPPYQGARGTLGSTTVALEGGEWTRVEIPLPAAHVREFALTIRFTGPVGARLWLDNATRIEAAFRTVPDEWSQLGLAHAFPSSLLAAPEAPAPRAAAPARHVGLLDAGFESGALASSPNRGWHCGDVDRGIVRAEGDDKQKTEGARSLRIDVVRRREVGRPPILQVAGVDGPGVHEFSLALRQEKMSSVGLVLGVWDERNVFQSLARRQVEPTAGRWSRYEVACTVPNGHDRIGVFVYAANEPGGRLWLDDARLERAK